MRRLVEMLRRQGLRATLRRVLGLVVRARSHLLFELGCDDAPEPELRRSEQVHVLTAENLAEHALLCDGLVAIDAENAEYLDDIRKNRVVGVVFVHEERIVHYGFVFKKNRTTCLLGLPAPTALVGNAFTAEAYRGRGCQGRSLHVRARVARDAGFSSVVAETGVDNVSSQRGMLKGGMRLLGRMDLVVVLNCLVIRWRRPAGFSLLSVCL